MIQDKKTLAGKIAGNIRMCMYIICGAAQNKYKQPKFLENCAEDSVYYRIVKLADDGHFDEAENLMYDSLNPADKDDYYTMLAAYEYMNDFDDEFLERNNFPREEIQDGITEITEKHDSEGLYTILLKS